MLSRIASMIGRPCGIDNLTKEKLRLSYVRLMVEVDASKPLKEFIMLKGRMGDIKKQLIEYEFRPFHCSKCMKFGHTAGRCSTVVTRAWQRRSDEPGTSSTVVPPAVSAVLGGGAVLPHTYAACFDTWGLWTWYWFSGGFY